MSVTTIRSSWAPTAYFDAKPLNLARQTDKFVRNVFGVRAGASAGTGNHLVTRWLLCADIASPVEADACCISWCEEAPAGWALTPGPRSGYADRGGQLEKGMGLVGMALSITSGIMRRATLQGVVFQNSRPGQGMHQ